MYKVVNGLLTTRLNDIFKNTSQIHSQNLRSLAHNFFILWPLSEAGKRTFNYRGATLWNSLPAQTKNQTTMNSFKETLSAN